MQIIDIKGKKWAIGVDWELLSSENSIKEEMKEIAEKTSSNFGVSVDFDTNFGIGLIKKSPPKAPLASYYLAMANQQFRSEPSPEDTQLDWIVLEEAGDDKYWMGVIKSGLPAPQFDALFDITTVKEKLVELMVYDTFKLFSTSGEISALFDGIKDVEKKGLAELTQDIKVKIKYEKLRGIPNSLIYAGAAIVGLIVVGYGASTFFEGRSLREKAENFQRQQQAENLRKQQEYQVAMKQFEEQSEKNKQVVLQDVANGLKGNPTQILTAWYSAVGNMDTGTHGWDLKNIECYYNQTLVVNKFACDYKFDRSSLATNRMLLEDYPHALINGNSAVVTFKIPINNEYLEESVVRNLNDLKGANTWSFDMLSQLQLLKIANIDHKIGASVDVTYTVPPKPVSPEQQQQGMQPSPQQTMSIGISKGQVSVKGTSFDLVQELADNVNFFGLGLRKVKFDVGGLGQIAWEATFDYYIKNGEGVMFSASSEPPATNQANPNGPIGAVGSAGGIVPDPLIQTNAR